MTYTIDGVEYTKQQVWQWLKAEQRHQVLEKRRKRQEGVGNHILALRRQGKPEAPQLNNRASKRATQRAARLAIKRMSRQARGSNAA